mmetsp:Transcript_117955/g.334492  ORF Transcript_117955/g.334492 Transcript_117955/m.334492 type:complete len:214 (-) Transcript_117955:541-1182(-)
MRDVNHLNVSPGFELYTGPSRLGSHRNGSDSLPSASRFCSARYRDMKTGICAKAGSSAARGFTPDAENSCAMYWFFSWTCRSFLSSGKSSWTCFCRGCSFCICVLDSICVVISGSVRNLTRTVNRTMLKPYVFSIPVFSSASCPKSIPFSITLATPPMKPVLSTATLPAACAAWGARATARAAAAARTWTRSLPSFSSSPGTSRRASALSSAS